MTGSGRFDHLRRSALELLAAGNSVASVAQVLAVPRSLVAGWRDQPSTAIAPDPVARVRAQGRAIRFATTLTHAAPLRFRVPQYLVGLYFVVQGAMLLAVLATYLRSRAWAVGLLGLFSLVAPSVAAARYFRLSRVGLILGPDAIIHPRLFGRTVWLYADLADWWLVSHVLNDGRENEIEGRMLTLHSRREGVRPIKVFIRDGDAFDLRLVERLALVKQANLGPGPLTRMGDIPKV